MDGWMCTVISLCQSLKKTGSQQYCECSSGCLTQYFTPQSPLYNIYQFTAFGFVSSCKYRLSPTMHNGLFSQNVTEGSLLHALRGVHPEHYLIPVQGYPNTASSDMHLFDLQVAARFVCFCCPIYNNPSQVMLWGRFLIYNSFLKKMLTINVKLLETVSRGGPARTKACCPDSVYSIGVLNHYFSDRKSAIGHFACKMYF